VGDYVISFNGLTGAVQGVSAAVGGTGISVSGATGAVTITNTGVHTINGATGTITNVAKTNVDNSFTESQNISGSIRTLTIYDTNSESSLVLNPNEQCLKYQSEGTIKLEFPFTGKDFTSTLPAYTTTLAGLNVTQTFDGMNTFSEPAHFDAGISAAGGTFSSPIRIPKLPHLTSNVFETKTTNWTPTDADNGKIFVVNISGKSTITCTLNGLSVGVHFKILVESGTVAFSITGTGNGLLALSSSVASPNNRTIYCTASNTYFGA
jgi:hypothetical protein